MNILSISSEEFFERVKEMVKVKGKQLLPFLEEVGINYNSWKSCRTYKNYPRVDEAFKIAKALDVSVEYLLTGVNQNEKLQPIIDKAKQLNSFSSEIIKSLETI